MSEFVLQLEAIYAGYTKEHVLSHLNFSVRQGEFVWLSGENGAGKTTLFQVILQSLRQDHGSLRVEGRLIERAEDRKWLLGRIGYVPQGRPQGKMRLSVYDAVLSGRWGKTFGWFRRPSRADRDHVMDRLTQVGLAELAEQDCRSLSGGQWQRMIVARALIREPALLLLDEPTTYLDTASRELLYTLLDAARTENPKLSMLMISHDKEEPAVICNRTVELTAGGIREVMFRV